MRSRLSFWKSVPPKRRALLLSSASLLLVLLVQAVMHWPMLGIGFAGDDYGLIESNVDLGWQGAFRFAAFGDYGDRLWAYWRPAWVLTFYLLHDAFGLHAASYQFVSLLMHSLLVAVIWLAGFRLSGSRMLASVAALWFALHPSHVQGIYWVCAATNVIPAALVLLFAATSLARYTNGGSRGWLLSSFVLMAASLLWKEAAYGFPVLFVWAWLGRPRTSSSGRRDHLALVVGVVAFLVIVAHYGLRNKVSGLQGGGAEIIAVFVHSLASFVRHLMYVPLGDGWLVAVAVLLWGVGFAFANAGLRFWLIAAAAGLVPYVFLSSGGRFAYLFHAPLAVAFAGTLSRLPKMRLSTPLCSLVAVAALVPLAWTLPELRAEQDVYRQASDQASALIDQLNQGGHLDASTIVVDRVPNCLLNGFEQAIQFRTGKTVKILSCESVPRPPFVVHLGLMPTSDTQSLPQFRLAPDESRYLPVGAAGVGLVSVPLFQLSDAYDLVADEAAGRSMLAEGRAKPVLRPLLYAKPAQEPQLGASGRISQIRTGIQNMGATIECSGPMLLVIAFPVPATFAEPGGIWIDGERVEPQAANILFYAVPVGAGLHDLRMLPVIGG